MSKKKRQKSISPSKNESPSVENQTAAKASANFPKFLIFGAIALLVCGGAAAAYFYKNFTAKRTNRPIGAVAACQPIPAFARGLGFGSQAVLSTSDRVLQGLVIAEGERKYQHPSWKSAGSLAPIQRDAAGNVYAAPAPWIDTLENKPAEQNKIYRVDADTQEMKEFVELPKPKTPTAENPFGVLGLTYDCDTSSLYAATVFGSTRREMNGGIYQIDVKTGKIVSQKTGFDPIGVGVFNSAKGKRLYYGSARLSEVWSVDLNDDGSLTGESRREISLENLGARGDDKARRINFVQNGQNFEMIVFGIEFGFNLIAPTEKQETVYRFRYDLAKDAWNYQAEPPKLIAIQ